MERAGKVVKTNLPAARKDFNGKMSRPGPSDIFNQNAERRGDSYRSGKDVETEIYLDRKNKKNTNGRPMVLPLKKNVHQRY